MDWPARTPNLDSIKNVRGVLPRRVYRDLRQFGNVMELRDCILHEWAKLDVELGYNLVRSMTRSCADILERKGLKLAH